MQRQLQSILRYNLLRPKTFLLWRLSLSRRLQESTTKESSVRQQCRSRRMRLENGVEADDGNAANNANRSGRGGLRLAVAALLASLSASLTGAEGVKARVGESLMRNPLVRATMATVAVETGGWSGIRALVLGGQGREALVRDPCGCARKKYITISRIQRRERRNIRSRMPLLLPPTTTKMTTRG
jgi:hypothetical protein